MSPHHSLCPSHNQNPNPNLPLSLFSTNPFLQPSPSMAATSTSDRRCSSPDATTPSSHRRKTQPPLLQSESVIAPSSSRNPQPPPRRDCTCQSRCHHHARIHGRCTFFLHHLAAGNRDESRSHLVKLLATHTAYACSSRSRRQSLHRNRSLLRRRRRVPLPRQPPCRTHAAFFIHHPAALTIIAPLAPRDSHATPLRLHSSRRVTIVAAEPCPTPSQPRHRHRQDSRQPWKNSWKKTLILERESTLPHVDFSMDSLKSVNQSTLGKADLVT